MTLAYVRLSAAVAAMFLCSGAGHAAPGIVTLPAPFAITLQVASAPGKDYFNLSNSGSSFDIIITNTTKVPQKVWVEECSDGYYSASLFITAINGQALTTPVGIGKSPRAWAGNAPITMTLYSGKETTHHIYLYEVPLLYTVGANSDTRLVSGIRLPRLRGTNSSQFETITAYAVFEPSNTNGITHTPQIVSNPVTFKTSL